MKKSKNYRLSEQALASLSFLLGKEYGKDATHVIECALAGAEAMWHMRDKLNTDQNALQHVEIGISEQKANKEAWLHNNPKALSMVKAGLKDSSEGRVVKAPLLRPNGKL
jgi:hypothetical protein